jgi:hypothetical protein
MAQARLRLQESSAGHVGTVVRALIASGWTVVSAPAQARLLRNRQLLDLEDRNERISLRLLVYKITKSSRGRAHERRVEITSTYGRGLEPPKGFRDVVLGFDPATSVFVGLDPVRLHHGGPTSNASSFLEVQGLARSPTSPFVVLTRQTSIFPTGESQAFFRPERLSEYLLNFAAIHAGSYPHLGIEYSKPVKSDWRSRALGFVDPMEADGDKLVLKRSMYAPRRAMQLSSKAIAIADDELTRRPRNLTPDELRAIQQRQAENGYLGEEFVYNFERKALSKAGRKRLAAKVDWISKRTVSAGYDIKSFDPQTAAIRYIEVKACQKTSSTFQASLHEWNTARRHGSQYYIYRVSSVRDDPKIDLKLRDPVALNKSGILRVSEASWKIKVVNKKSG